MSVQGDLMACCSATYGHSWARWLLGDSFHPGGLELTSRLAGLMGVQPSSRVLDAGSGMGASAVHLARQIECRVTGVTLEEEGVRAGRELAAHHGVENRVEFHRGDLGEVNPGDQVFDYALLECVLSIVPDKAKALRHLFRLLRDGGALGVSDVTVSGPLPDELGGVLATVGCVGGALSLDEYRAVAEGQGFVVEVSQHCDETVHDFLADVDRKMAMAEVAVKLGGLPVGDGLIGEGKRMLESAREQARLGTLGYGVLVARKPTRSHQPVNSEGQMPVI